MEEDFSFSLKAHRPNKEPETDCEGVLKLREGTCILTGFATMEDGVREEDIGREGVYFLQDERS